MVADKKVLHLISSGGFFGAEKVVVELSRETAKLGIKPFVGIIYNSFNPHNEICEPLKVINISYIIFECNSRFDLKTISSIRQYIKRNGIDIVHSHGYKANLFAFISSVFTKTKRVSTVHNWIKTDFKVKIYALLDKFILKGFDKVVVVSQALMNELSNSWISVNRIILIKNGINTEEIDLRQVKPYIKNELGIKENEKVVGTVGRISEEKGQVYLVAAALQVFKECPNTKFLFVGNGPLKDELISNIQKDNLEEHFIFTGQRSDINLLLSIMDVFVMPSLVEGMPMALLEAMLAHKSIVASRVGEIPNIITDNLEGILIGPKDVEGLAEAIICLLKNKDKAKRLAENGYRKVFSFSSEKMAEDYLKKAYL